MIDRNLLIIDDEDQSEILKDIQNMAHQKGVNVRYLQYNVGSSEENNLFDSNGKLVKDKIIKRYKTLYSNENFDLIACDYDLGDEIIDGVEVLRSLEEYNVGRESAKMIYSGRLDKIVGAELENFRKGNSRQSEVEKHIRSLINMNLQGCWERGDEMKSQIVSYLVNHHNCSLDIIDIILSQSPDFKLHKDLCSGIFAKIHGMSWAEVREKINSDPNLKEKLTEELIRYAMMSITNDIN